MLTANNAVSPTLLLAVGLEQQQRCDVLHWTDTTAGNVLAVGA